ncbi:hypothetical protein IMAU70023_03126 [Lactiplantibacillus plantarum]|nr:hypothetical protein [Lactiplantibacillus plantarum]MCG0616414.1 hypothetical protein [Lactiplantibacillus plantarum]MCG0712649.1 hypothetical protein [Lactiplantibacillus plantarum]
MKLSIYMLNKTTTQVQAISAFIKSDIGEVKKKRLKKSEINGYRKGLLFYQEIPSEPWWFKVVNENFLSNPLKMKKSIEYRAVVILQINRNFMALSFNNGILLVDRKYIRDDFGFIVAEQLLTNKTISKVDSVEVSETIMNISKNSHRGIPVHSINNSSLTAIVSIAGKDSERKSLYGKYKLDIDFTGNIRKNLIDSLKKLSNLYRKRSKNVHVEGNLKKIADKQIIENLDNELAQQIIDFYDLLYEKQKGEIPLSKVQNLFLNFGSLFEETIITGLGKPYTLGSENDIVAYIERLCRKLKQRKDNQGFEINLNSVITKLKRDRIFLKDMEKNVEVESDSVFNALIAEYPLKGDKLYKAILIQGNWYYISIDYYAGLKSNLEKQMRSTSNIEFIPFLKNYKEKKNGKLVYSEGVYNDKLALANDCGLLDKNFLKFNKETMDKYDLKNSSKIEACDLLKYDDSSKTLTLVHNKVHENPSGISHLCTQVNICADLITNQDTKKEFIKFLNKESGYNIPTNISRDKVHIILGIIDKQKKIGEAFSILEMKALNDCFNNLKNAGILSMLELIPTHKK